MYRFEWIFDILRKFFSRIKFSKFFQREFFLSRGLKEWNSTRLLLSVERVKKEKRRKRSGNGVTKSPVKHFRERHCATLSHTEIQTTRIRSCHECHTWWMRAFRSICYNAVRHGCYSDNLSFPFLNNEFYSWPKKENRHLSLSNFHELHNI